MFLLFADKRIGAGKALIEGNQVPLGISTLIKGEGYFERALAEANKIKSRGGDIQSLTEKLRGASLKYEEILLELKEKVNSEGKGAIDDLLKKIRIFQEQVFRLD